MFLISKFMVLLTQPLVWVGLMLVLGLLQLQRRPQAARQFFQTALVLLMLVGWLVAFAERAAACPGANASCTQTD